MVFKWEEPSSLKSQHDEKNETDDICYYEIYSYQKRIIGYLPFYIFSHSMKVNVTSQEVIFGQLRKNSDNQFIEMKHEFTVHDLKFPCIKGKY